MILPIPGFPGYFADNEGDIWTAKRRGSQRIDFPLVKMHPCPSQKGYLIVCLRTDGRAYTMPVHQLVLMAFEGPKPDGMEGCHYPDSDKTNNRPENLRWDIHAENGKDRYRDRTEKKCCACKTVKPLSEFHSSKRGDGLQGVCKECSANASKKWKESNLEKVREYQRNWKKNRRRQLAMESIL